MSELCWCGGQLTADGECMDDPWTIWRPFIREQMAEALDRLNAKLGATPAPEAIKKPQTPAIDMGRPVCNADSEPSGADLRDFQASGVVRGASEGDERG